MSKYTRFINRYPVSKTLKFRLIPQGATEEIFKSRHYLESDQQRAKDYALVKKMIDRYHKGFIEKSLGKLGSLIGLNEYADLYYSTSKEAEDYARMDEISSAMRQQISGLFTSQPEFKSLFGKDMILKLLPTIVSEEEAEIVHHFNRFATYFIGFNQVRASMYTGEGKASEVAFRAIDQNLPKYLDNCMSGTRVLDTLSEDAVRAVEAAFPSVNLRAHFEPEHFNSVVTQAGIDLYNAILGGYTTEEGKKKVKGLNEFINEHNQVSENKLPKLKPLFKQILSDRETLSFIPDKFESDNQVLNAIYSFFNEPNADTGMSGSEALSGILELLSGLSKYKLSEIYVSAKELSEVSTLCLGDWSSLQRGLNAIYDADHSEKERSVTSYEDTRRKFFKARNSFSLEELQNAITIARGNSGLPISLVEKVGKKSKTLELDTAISYGAAKQLISNPYTFRKKLQNNDTAITQIKNFLDAMMDVLHFAACFSGSGKEDVKDEVFYGDFSPMYNQMADLVTLYNKVRNYVTAKPYSSEKFKLNFEKGDFLSGWSQRFEKKGAMLLERDGKYYMMVLADKFPASTVAQLYDVEEGEKATLLAYRYQKPDNKNVPRTFIRSKADKLAPAVEELELPVHEILDLYDQGLFKREYAKKDPDGQRKALEKLIDYFKEGFRRHPSYQEFDMEAHWRPSSEYESIDKFYRDCMLACYKIEKQPINWTVLNDLVTDGQVYLFQIYSQDFSEKAHGRPGLHTMYFKALFDEENLANTCYMLNGGAEMFFRPASLSLAETTIHPAEQPIKNKNPLSEKPESTYQYDIIKNRRFTRDHYELHLAITANFSYAGSERINADVRTAIREDEVNYVVGIDRGEANLLYVCVVNRDGKIVEQRSLDSIYSEHDGKVYETNYNALLAARENERQQARKNWTTINDIKNLKEGYCSRAVAEIVRLAIKYDAVIALEDLSLDFKQSRVKIEKSVYQQLERQLIEKLNFMVDKRLASDEPGGLYCAYQLCQRFESFSKMGRQNGFLFFESPYMTSRVDPVTGFVDMLRPRYENVQKAKEFFGSFDTIRYDDHNGFFVFDTDYEKFPKTENCPRKKWQLCTFGDRIEAEKDAKSGTWHYEPVHLTTAFRSLFDAYGIVVRDGEDLKEQILTCDNAAFFKELTRLTRLMLQMQNSMPGQNVDYLISPALDDDGRCFWSASGDPELPLNTAATGAYNIARKALWAIRKMKDAEAEAFYKTPISPTNTEWLDFIQR